MPALNYCQLVHQMLIHNLLLEKMLICLYLDRGLGSDKRGAKMRANLNLLKSHIQSLVQPVSCSFLLAYPYPLPDSKYKRLHMISRLCYKKQPHFDFLLFTIQWTASYVLHICVAL